jgi:hypothetical protein
MSVGCGAVSFDVEFHNDSDEKTLLPNLMLTVSTLSTVVLLYAIFWKYRSVLAWEKARGMYEKPDNLYTTGRIKPLVIEMALNFIHPSIMFSGLYLDVYDVSENNTTTYSWNSVLTTISMIRIYHIGLAFIIRS